MSDGQVSRQLSVKLLHWWVVILSLMVKADLKLGFGVPSFSESTLRWHNSRSTQAMINLTRAGTGDHVGGTSEVSSNNFLSRKTTL
jgi:hypothetical protein